MSDDGQRDCAPQRKTTPDLQEEWWQTKRACQFLSRLYGDHLVGLFVAYKLQERDFQSLYTGFLYRHRGYPFWISAGHVIESLDALQRPEITIIQAEWNDMVEDGTNRGIPLALSHLSSCPFQHEGVDFGFVFLGAYFENLLLKVDGNSFFDEEALFQKEEASPECFYLLGFPAECHDIVSSETERRTNRTLWAPLHCLPLERIADRPGQPGDFWGRPGSIYFQILPFLEEDEHSLESIKYMSGGPIVSIEITDKGQAKYYLFGVQGSWLPKQRIIRATNSEIMKAVLDGFLDKVLSQPIDVDTSSTS